MKSENFEQWTKNQEEMVATTGHSIKIRSKKADRIRTFFMIIGIVFVSLSVLSIFAIKVVAKDLINENKTITIKVIHEITLSNETRIWIEQKAPELGDWIVEELR